MWYQPARSMFSAAAPAAFLGSHVCPLLESQEGIPSTDSSTTEIWGCGSSAPPDAVLRVHTFRAVVAAVLNQASHGVVACRGRARTSSQHSKQHTLLRRASRWGPRHRNPARPCMALQASARTPRLSTTRRLQREPQGGRCAQPAALTTVTTAWCRRAHRTNTPTATPPCMRVLGPPSARLSA